MPGEMPFGAWPKPLPDEPLYSILARLKFILGLTNQGLLDIVFSGSKITQIDVNLPDRLRDLRIGNWVVAAQEGALLRNHTSFPYLSWFLSHTSQERLNERLEISRSEWTKPRAFSEERPHKRRNLTFCPRCQAEDIANADMAGWRRVHQFPGVFVCPWHEDSLLTSSVPAYRNPSLVDCSGVKSGVEITNPLVPTDALDIAKISLWLVSNTALARHRDFRIPVIKVLLERDFANHRGELTSRFWNAFIERFTLPGIEILRWNWDNLDPPDIPSILWQKPTANEIPIRLIALMVFLGLTADDVFGSISEPASPA